MLWAILAGVLNIVEEYIRIFLFAIPPTLFFILTLMLANNYPQHFNPPFPPFLVLALISGCSCFIFGSDGLEGYFQTLPTIGEKGFRLMMIKLLEMYAEKLAFDIFKYNPAVSGLIDNNFQSDRTWKTCFAIYCLSVLTIAGLRTVIIFPYVIFLTKWTTRIPSSWYPLAKDHEMHIEVLE